MEEVITSHHIWFLLAVTQTDAGKKPAHATPAPFQFWLAWHNDFLAKHGRCENPAAEALAVVRAMLREKGAVFRG
jgi:hypothetical protein